ncbi:hypothetical protein [Neobacillus kokaensis]|uniref:Uncharacterized protein n=1 Tax=Neobacillus kokaensis TaxID=2759023 RepID=A0ABQ3NA11_9BACI|nr:hypothetical protein [Neobacillus kokaensis]GHH98516.1 hypothetical protein AM1BK_20590 [Neobacillus kokaensis]
MVKVKEFANLGEICGGVTVEVHPDGDKVIDVLLKWKQNRFMQNILGFKFKKQKAYSETP